MLSFFSPYCNRFFAAKQGGTVLLYLVTEGGITDIPNHLQFMSGAKLFDMLFKFSTIVTLKFLW